MANHIKNGEAELISASSPDPSLSSSASDAAAMFSPTAIVVADATKFTVKVHFNQNLLLFSFAYL